MIRSSLQMFVCFAVIIITSENLQAQELNYIYKSGDNGYSCFRIPSLITTKKGTVLAFAEARRNSCGDAGDIDLVVKRSSDGGKTWGEMQMVWNDSTNTCGNPAPVIDQRTGRIVLLTTWNLGSDHEKQIIADTSKDTRRVFVLYSTDDGLSWSSAKEITTAVKKPEWSWYATGPGRGLQITKGKYKNRMVVPANHIRKGTRQNYSQVIISDDAGENWRLGGITKQDSVNESTVAELSDGRLLYNMRNASSKRVRQTAISEDGGESWSDLLADTTLIEPVCEGNLIRYKYKGKREALVFSNPASRTAREKMTARMSYDDGKSWVSKLIYPGPSAYSCLTVLKDGRIACLYEAGLQKPYEGIAYITLKTGEIVSSAK